MSLQNSPDSWTAPACAFPNSLAGALAKLDGTLSPDVMAELAAELPGGPPGVLGSATWGTIAAKEMPQILEILDGETPEVCAILLSKLPSTRAAVILGEMERERGRHDRRGLRVDRSGAPIDGRPYRYLARQRVGECGTPRLYGRSGGPDRRNPQCGHLRVAQRDAGRSGCRIPGIRGPRSAARCSLGTTSPNGVDGRDVSRILRAVENPQLIAALSNEIEGPVAKFLLDAISPRLAEQIRGEIEDAGTIKPEDSESAQQAIAAAIRDMEDKGEISFVLPEAAEGDSPGRRAGD